MKSHDIHSGSCLCGAVSYEVTGPLRDVMYCHCSQCRKTSGHYVAATSCATENLELTGADSLTWYRSSASAERGFCSVCGGNLFWKPDHGRYICIFAGTMDLPTGLRAASHMYVSDKSDYFQLADGLPQHEQDIDTA